MMKKNFLSFLGVRIAALLVVLLGQAAKAEDYGQNANPFSDGLLKYQLVAGTKGSINAQAYVLGMADGITATDLKIFHLSYQYIDLLDLDRFLA
ncbi:MAG: hypothetical protein IKO12_04055 [Bacteroidaceae bacterium]|nr:hypothetical protein [Bacteroidaceae bacterium]